MRMHVKCHTITSEKIQCNVVISRNELTSAYANANNSERRNMSWIKGWSDFRPRSVWKQVKVSWSWDQGQYGVRLRSSWKEVKVILCWNQFGVRLRSAWGEVKVSLSWGQSQLEMRLRSTSEAVEVGFSCHRGLFEGKLKSVWDEEEVKVAWVEIKVNLRWVQDQLEEGRD